MADNEWLTERFEEQRTHLQAVAYRMLGSLAEADDAVQEAWLRLNRSNPGEIENLSGWLTTVVARVSLNMLRSRRVRREDALGVHGGWHHPVHFGIIRVRFDARAGLSGVEGIAPEGVVPGVVRADDIVPKVDAAPDVAGLRRGTANSL